MERDSFEKDLDKFVKPSQRTDELKMATRVALCRIRLMGVIEIYDH